jgi:hypothetical protein
VAGIESAAVNNAYHLADYIDILKKGLIPQNTSDTRRDTRNAQPQAFPERRKPRQFDRIVEVSTTYWPTVYRQSPGWFVDRGNIGNLPDLAQFPIDKGWTASPLFKTQTRPQLRIARVPG